MNEIKVYRDGQYDHKENLKIKLHNQLLDIQKKVDYFFERPL